MQKNIYFYAIIFERDFMKVKIEKLDHFGRGIVKINNKICFVKNALPNEIVEVNITNDKKKYMEAEVVNITDEASMRIESICPYYDVCGGCGLQHVNIDYENDYKRQKVNELINRYGNVNDVKVEEIYCDEEYFYRNKVVLHVKNGEIGFYKEKSNDLIAVKKCFLLDEKINDLFPILEDFVKDNSVSKIIIRVSNERSSVMLKVEGEVSNFLKLEQVVDVLIINDKVVFGDDKIISTIGNKKYYVSIDSFFQVNKTLTEKLYDQVFSLVQKIKPSKVLDLYCGTGTIGIYISDAVSQIVGIDCSSSSIKDAFCNKELNRAKNIEFLCDKVENVIDQFRKDIDLIIVDPPRAGLDRKTIDNILRISPDNIIYISCDPVTLARDINLLSSDYCIEQIKLFNMFPRTYHVESLVLLKKVK